MSTCNCTIRPPREESVGPVAIFYGVPTNLLAPHSVLCNRSPVISHDRTGSNDGGEGFYRRRGREICGGVINWRRLATFRTPGACGMGGAGGARGYGVGSARAAVSKHVLSRTWGEDKKPAYTWLWMGPSLPDGPMGASGATVYQAVWTRLSCISDWSVPKIIAQTLICADICSLGISYLNVRESKSHPDIIKSHHDVIISLIIWLITRIAW